MEYAILSAGAQSVPEEMLPAKPVRKEETYSTIQGTERKSYLGRTYRDSGFEFPPGKYESTFLQERARQQRLYSTIHPEDITSRIHSAFSSHNQEDIAALNEQLTSYLPLLDPSRISLLTAEQRQDVQQLLDTFSRNVFTQAAVVKARCDGLQAIIEQWSAEKDSERYVIGKLEKMDREVYEYSFWQERKWLDGSLLMPGNPATKEYLSVIEYLDSHREFWDDYLVRYTSMLFSSPAEVREEYRYIANITQEQFRDIRSAAAKMRLRHSVPSLLERELRLLEQDLKKYNMIKEFVRTAVQEIEQEKERIEAGLESVDYIAVLRDRYAPVERVFPGFQNLIYYYNDAAVYNERAIIFGRWLQQKELELEEKIKKEKEEQKKRGDYGSFLIVRPSHFDISLELKKFMPRNTVLRELKQALYAGDWHTRLDKVQGLLQEDPEFYSSYDHDFLNNTISTLEISLQEGVLASLCEANIVLQEKVTGTIDAMRQYCSTYGHWAMA